MSTLIVLLSLYVVGLPVSMVLGKQRTPIVAKLTVGVLAWIVSAGILGFTKNVPSTPFLNTPWLLSAYVPFLMVIPFYLYLKSKNILLEIKNDWKHLLLIGAILISVTWIVQIQPAKNFRNQVIIVSESSLITPYNRVDKLEKNTIGDYGAELLVSYFGEVSKSGSTIYHSMLILMLMLLIMLIVQTFERLKINWKFLVGLAWILVSLAIELVVFSDVLVLLILLSGWMILTKEIRAKNILLTGILLSGLLTVNSAAILWWVIPSLLLIRPKELGLSLGVAILINPMLVGSLK